MIGDPAGSRRNNGHPVGAWHRVENPGDAVLVFIEIQRGDYFGE